MKPIKKYSQFTLHLQSNKKREQGAAANPLGRRFCGAFYQLQLFYVYSWLLSPRGWLCYDVHRAGGDSCGVMGGVDRAL